MAPIPNSARSTRKMLKPGHQVSSKKRGVAQQVSPRKGSKWRRATILRRAAFFSLLKLSCRAETLARSIRLIQFARRLFFFCLECVCVASSDLGRAWGISAEVCGNLHLFSVSCGSRSSFDSSLRNGACKIAKVHVLRTCKARLVNLVPELETTP